MEHSPATRFFLGANSASGFFSLYDGFPGPADFLWVIKGGPGCGKSSFMKRLGAAAESAGLRTEYILCSGDPDSLDGVYFPDRHVAYVDGTAPHVVEAKCPGAASRYLDMSTLLDVPALRPLRGELAALTCRYQALYAAAYARLAAGAALLPGNAPCAAEAADPDALARRMDALAARELRPLKKQGRVTERFLSAWSCRGHLTLTDTLDACCERLYLLDNGLGLGHAALSRLAALAAARGYDAVLCRDPLEPAKIEALLLPERALGFLAADTPEKLRAALRLPCRRLRLDSAAGALSPDSRALLRYLRRESRTLLRSAVEALAEAKELHDALEALYRPHVDFSGADALAETHIRRLLDL